MTSIKRLVALILLAVASASMFAVAVPYTENFDAVTAPAVPADWVIEDTNGDAKLWVTAASGGTGDPATNAMKMVYNSAMDMDDWAFSPALDLEAGKTYKIGFNYKSQSATYTENLAIHVGDAAASANMGEAILDLLDIGSITYQEGSVVYTPATDGQYFIGFHGHSSADMYNLYFDDVTVAEAVDEEAPTVVSLAGNEVTQGAPMELVLTLADETGLAADPIVASYTIDGGTAMDITFAPQAKNIVGTKPVREDRAKGEYIYTATIPADAVTAATTGELTVTLTDALDNASEPIVNALTWTADIEGPTVMVNSAAYVMPDMPAMVKANVSDVNDVTSVTLSYDINASGTPVELAMTMVDEMYTAEIPAQMVDAAATCTVKAIDESGNETITDAFMINWKTMLTDDIEDYESFALEFGDFQQIDLDEGASYGVNGVTFTNSGYTGSYIVLEPAATEPALASDSWIPHSGDKYLACFNAVTASAPNNDWLVSPTVQFGETGIFSFFGRSVTTQYGAEKFRVLVAPTASAMDTEAYTVVSTELHADGEDHVQAPAAWTEYSVDMSAYAGQEVVVAIQCISNDAFALLLDDFTLVDAVAIEPIDQSIAFEDDFEAGADKWSLEGTWAITDEAASSPTHSLTESPGGNYAADINISATVANPIDLSIPGFYGATLSFMTEYSIEEGAEFDNLYIEASGDNGTTWDEIAFLEGEGVAWHEQSFDVSGYIGTADFKFRFRFYADGGYETTGSYIDDVLLKLSDVDEMSPQVLYAGPTTYEATLEDYTFTAELRDPSGISGTAVVYTVDGGDAATVAGTLVSGDVYTYTIPAQDAGAMVEYKITAIDNAAALNAGETMMYQIVTGTHLIYDSNIVSYYTTIEPANDPTATATQLAIANLATVPQTKGMAADLKGVAIRFYEDVSGHQSGEAAVHVYKKDAEGMPGEELTSAPVTFTPDHNGFHYVDLRDLNITSVKDFFVALKAPVATVYSTTEKPSEDGMTDFMRSYTLMTDGTTEGWQFSADNNYMIRPVIGESYPVGINELLPEKTALAQNYPNPFNPTTAINYSIATNGHVELAIYNVRGQQIAQLINGNVKAGFYNVNFNASTLNSGVYYYRLKAAGTVMTKKMILVK